MQPCELSRFNQLPKAPLARLKQLELDGFQKQAKWSSNLQFLDQILSEDERAEFPDWSVQFKAWLFYADSEFEAMLLHVEENIATPVDVSGFSDENKERVAQLHSILTGILKGRPFRILRNVSDRKGLANAACSMALNRSWPPWCCSWTASGPRRPGCSLVATPRPPARRRPTGMDLRFGDNWSLHFSLIPNRGQFLC